MRLSLSSAAAPDEALAELLAACARRGLTALELVEGHGHGVSAGIDADRADAVCAAALDAGVEICGLHREGLDRGDLETAARLAAALEAPLVVPAGEVDRETLPEASAAFRAAGAHLLLAHGSDPAAVELLGRSLATLPDPETVGLAWEVRPERDDPALLGGGADGGRPAPALRAAPRGRSRGRGADRPGRGRADGAPGAGALRRSAGPHPQHPSVSLRLAGLAGSGGGMGVRE